MAGHPRSNAESPQVVVDIDHDRAQALGVTPGGVLIYNKSMPKEGPEERSDNDPDRK
jgi:hypothetical protein